jgi:general stress protein 26
MSEQLAAIQERTFARSRPATSESFGPATRLTAEQLSAYLDRRAFATVCTARPDGRPHAAMTSFFRQDDVFWLPAVADSVRAVNIGEQPWTSLVVAEGDRDAHIVVTIEGVADVVQTQDVPSEVRDQVDGDWVDVWIRLTANRVLSYGAANALK